MPRKRKTDALPIVVAERERKLIASDLHDTICQSLASLSLVTSALLRRKEAGKEIEAKDLRAMETQLIRVLDQCRSLAAFDIVKAQPGRLPEKIRECVRLFSSDRDCALEIDPPDISVGPPEIAQHFYRIVGEIVPAFVRQNSTGLAISLRQTAAGFSLQIHGRDLRPESCRKIFRGDGMLKRFSEILGVEWKVEGATLNCLSRNPPRGRHFK